VHRVAQAARPRMKGTVDAYRQTVLVGFQQVEDELVTLRLLEQQAVIEEARRGPPPGRLKNSHSTRQGGATVPLQQA